MPTPSLRRQLVHLGTAVGLFMALTFLFTGAFVVMTLWVALVITFACFKDFPKWRPEAPPIVLALCALFFFPVMYTQTSVLSWLHSVTINNVASFDTKQDPSLTPPEIGVLVRAMNSATPLFPNHMGSGPKIDEWMIVTKTGYRFRCDVYDPPQFPNKLWLNYKAWGLPTDLLINKPSPTEWPHIDIPIDRSGGRVELRLSPISPKSVSQRPLVSVDLPETQRRSTDFGEIGDSLLSAAHFCSIRSNPLCDPSLSPEAHP